MDANSFGWLCVGREGEGCMSIYRADGAGVGSLLAGGRWIVYRGGGGTLCSRPARVVCVTSPVTPHQPLHPHPVTVDI